MSIILDDNIRRKINDLIIFVYDSVEIKYVYILNDDGSKTKYYNRPNQWHGNYDEDGECNGEYDCDFHDQISTNKHIHYVFKFKPDINRIIDYRIDNPIGQSILTDNELNILTSGPLKEIFIECPKKLVIHNISGFNEDHRGSDHTKLILDFHDDYTLIPINGKISLKKFADACLRIRSHKFENCYEMYCGVDSVEIGNNKIIANVVFDHGS